MSSEVKVSVIISVYNNEFYLRECLDSIINQTLKEIEIIIVNDGSTDNSLEVIEEYAHRDKRIVIINKENEGISKTRNRGLDICKGEYIQFIDSDDYIDNNMIENMYNVATNNELDIVMCGYKRITDNKQYNNLPEIKIDNIIDKKGILGYLTNSYENKLLWFVWRNMYKNELLKLNNIRFKEDLRFGEDSIFNLECFLEAQRIMAVDKCFYNYRYTPDSLTSRKYKSYLFNNLNTQYKEKISIYKKYSLESLMKEDVDKNFIKHLLPICIGNEINNTNNSLTYNIKKMKKYEFVDDIIRNNSIKLLFDERYTLKEKIRFIIIKYNLIPLIKIIYR